MRIQFAFAALMCVCSLNAFQVPAVAEIPQQPTNDCAIYLIKIVADVNKLIPLVEDKDWSKILPLAIDLGENLSAAYQCIHQTKFGSLFQQVKDIVSDPCPYLVCLHKHLAPANVLGIEFVKLLVQGKQESAKDILPDIVNELTAATECGKQ